MGYLWPPRWWPGTSLSPVGSSVADHLAEEKERERRDYIAGFFSVPADYEPTEDELIEAEASFEKWWAERDKLCDRCGQCNFMGQPMHVVGGRAEVCTECFSFLTGTGGSDPLDKPVPPDETEYIEQGWDESPWWERLLRWFGVR